MLRFTTNQSENQVILARAFSPMPQPKQRPGATR
jgi:hypothetical protein